MPIYRYKAFNSVGKKIAGILEADSLELARDRLLREKALIYELILQKDKKRRAPYDRVFVLQFTRQLHQLLIAGLPLYEGLLSLEEKYKKHRLHRVLLELGDKLKSGYAFSAALKAHPELFNDVYIAMVEAGEASGNLSWSFAELHRLLEREQILRKQVISSLIYPSFLASFCLLIALVLLLYVIPSMRELFDARQLHPLSEAVLALSDFLRKFGYWILGGITVCSALFTFFFLKFTMHQQLQRLKQRIPFIKKFIFEAALVRFNTTSSMLLAGGVPLVEALKLARRMMKHSELEAALKECEHGLLEGCSLSHEMRKFAILPPLMVRMVATAQETGKLSDALAHLADIYEFELKNHLSQFTAFLQPILLLILGFIIGMLVLAILLPLTDVSSLS